MFVWSDTQGKDILADFVGIENDMLVMRLPSQATARMPMNTLAAGSRQLALDLQTKPGQPVWTPLCDGTTLAGWKGDITGYQIISAVLTSTATGGDLISDNEYGSFHLKFDLRLSPGGNNGIGVWCAENKGSYKFLAHTGFEIQIMDDTSSAYAASKPWQMHGALTYFIKPKVRPMGPVGSWNTHEIRMEGTKLTVIINNITVIQQELPMGDPEPEGSRRHRLDLSKRCGHLVLCGRQGPVEFRNLRIKQL